VIEVHVDAGTHPGAPVPLLESAVRTVLGAEGLEEGEVSVALLADADIRALNRTHLSRDRVTDVIAFRLEVEGRPVVGDVYLGWEQALRQAAAAGVAPEEELVRLVVHGTLHVLGWDHPAEPGERESSAMYRRQEELVAQVVR
jgi:probable rRNA maturation factor